MKTSLSFFSFSIILSLLIPVVSGAGAPKYNPAEHFYKADASTGHNIGASLYQLKTDEMQTIVKKVVDEVNAMSAQELFKYATTENIFKDQGDLSRSVKIYKIEKWIDARNMALIKKMNALPLPRLTEIQARTRVSTLTDRQVIDTALSIDASPANDANFDLRQKYDPQGNFGFCFLRSHFYVNEAGLRGLVRDSIKKVFAVGKMMPLGFIPIGTWQFHVAATVRGEAGVWKVLDNHLGTYQEEASSVTDWYNHLKRKLESTSKYTVVNAYGQNEELEVKSLFLYFTDPLKIGPSSNGYNAEAFYGVDTDRNGRLEGKEVFYNGIFQDVDQYLTKNRPDVCDPRRYQPLKANDPRCL